MAAIWNRLGKLLPARVQKGFVGYDLQGNSYFEVPSPAGGRMKRTVEYKISRDLSEYTSGQHRLPVQWTTWLSHTRSNPPTIEELSSDTNRQSRLKPLIQAIEERELAERIRQGYIPDPALAIEEGEGRGTTKLRKSIAGPSTTGHGQLNTRPSFSQPDQRPVEQTGQPPSSPTSSPSPTSAPSTIKSTNIPAPGQTVDPGLHDNPAELRRLAEEDTKRRISERGGESDLRPSGEGVEGVNVGGGGGLAPRRRRK